MASLLGVGILQFIGKVHINSSTNYRSSAIFEGMQALGLIIMALSSVLKRRKRSTSDDIDDIFSFYS